MTRIRIGSIATLVAAIFLFPSHTKAQEALAQKIDGYIARYNETAPLITLDQTKQEVLSILPPQSGLGQQGRGAEMFPESGKTIEIYYFRSARIPDGNITDDEFTPYVFIDGKLQSVGWSTLGGPRTRGDVAAAEGNRSATERLIIQQLLKNMNK